MGVRYYYGNVLDCKTSVAHCVSADLKMGRGIAKEIKERFMPHVKNYKHTTHVGSVITTKYKYGYIYNLVTKKCFFDKPRLQIVRSALIRMKLYAVRNREYEIHMPKIGCGLDKLCWDDVEKIIRDLFIDSSVDIAICFKEDDILL